MIISVNRTVRGFLPNTKYGYEHQLS